ncbi:MAG: acyltransferase [Nitrospirota bacterium]
MNTLFNVVSGDIVIGDNTLFGHGCMVLTGIHEFFDGVRGDLHDPPIPETPTHGRDIRIGSGCFIGSGAIILGNVTIGDNVIIGAGAVVSRDIPSNSIAAGIPAKVIRSLGA